MNKIHEKLEQSKLEKRNLPISYSVGPADGSSSVLEKSKITAKTEMSRYERKGDKIRCGST